MMMIKKITGLLSGWFEPLLTGLLFLMVIITFGCGDKSEPLVNFPISNQSSSPMVSIPYFEEPVGVPLAKSKSIVFLKPSFTGEWSAVLASQGATDYPYSANESLKEPVINGRSDWKVLDTKPFSYQLEGVPSGDGFSLWIRGEGDSFGSREFELVSSAQYYGERSDNSSALSLFVLRPKTGAYEIVRLDNKSRVAFWYSFVSRTGFDSSRGSMTSAGGANDIKEGLLSVSVKVLVPTTEPRGLRRTEISENEIETETTQPRQGRKTIVSEQKKGAFHHE